MTRLAGMVWLALLVYGIAVGCEPGRHREVAVEEGRGAGGRWLVTTWCRCERRCYGEREVLPT